MSFYLGTNGVLRNHFFDYLSKEKFGHRLEKTLVSGDKPFNRSPAIIDDSEVIVSELMRKNPLTIEIDTPLISVQKIFKEKGFRHLPVLKDSRIVIGMISDRDLLKVETMGTFQFLAANAIMKTILILVDEDTPVAQVAKVMVEEKISAMPVINKEHHMVGIITKTDLLKGLFEYRLRDTRI